MNNSAEAFEPLATCRASDADLLAGSVIARPDLLDDPELVGIDDALPTAHRAVVRAVRGLLADGRPVTRASVGDMAENDAAVSVEAWLRIDAVAAGESWPHHSVREAAGRLRQSAADLLLRERCADIAATRPGDPIPPRRLDALRAALAEPVLPARPAADDKPSWPAPPADEALTGPAGDFVRLVLPQTESDPAALLFQFLVAFGSMVGRTAHFVVGADRHFARLFACVVGATGSGGRKGTSYGFVEHLMQMVDPKFRARQLPSLASGEGLIAHVQDAGAGEDADPGVIEKRLLIREGEFARVLTVMSRDSNPLSAVLRDAWDDRTLSVPTRKDPLTATETHISIVANVTMEELRKKLAHTDMFNGFANRFLWVCSARLKHLPSGGDLDRLDFSPLVVNLRASIEHATRTGRIRFSADAEALFAEVYPALTDGREGLVGAVTARADAYVRRLGLVYALLARRSEIDLSDMQAALAAWRYCEDSAAYLFGGGTAPDRLTGRVLSILGDGQTLDRRTIHRAIGGHTAAGELDRVRDVLVAGRRLRVTAIPAGPGGGRPAESWTLTGDASKPN